MKNIETYKYFIENNDLTIKNYLGLHKTDKITSIYWNDYSFLLKVTYSNNKHKSFDYLNIYFTHLEILMDNHKDYLSIDKIVDDLYDNDPTIYLNALKKDESINHVLISYLIKKYSLKDKHNPYTLGGSHAVTYAYDILTHIKARSTVHYDTEH